MAVNLREKKATCPHCWHRFYPDEAWYISRHAELYGDAVLGDHENRRFAPHEVKRDREGNALDEKGWKMVERACPRCHLQIPQTLLDGQVTYISVVGAPRSGKTYLLTSMIHELRRDLAKSFGFSLLDSDSHEVRLFLDYERALFFPADPQRPTLLKKTQEQGELYNTVRIDGADVQLPKPFIFSLRPTETNIDVQRHGAALHHELVLYDNAGESFEFLKEKSASNRVTQHLGACDAVLFVLDPLQQPEARVRLSAVSADPQLSRAATSYRQETILTEVANRMRRHRKLPADQRLPVPLLVCVAKYDVWKTLLPHVRTSPGASGEASLIDHTSVEFFPQLGVAGLDVEEVNLISLLVRSFVNDLCPELVALAEAQFRFVRYFPLSALGTSPEYDVEGGGAGSEMLKVRPANLQPFRVTHPMLWLLHAMQKIRRVKAKNDGAAKYPTAQLQAADGERMRLAMPGGSVLILDRDYAGSVIVDPASGQRVWVPAIGAATAEAKTEGPAKAASAPPKPKLTMEEPPRPKRGWFRK